MSHITVFDFIPPIFPRATRYLQRILSGNNGPHPFDQVPKDIDAKLIIDVGANVGDVTIAALKTYPKCRVICFEPVNSTSDILSARLASYGDRVTIYNEALSTTNGSGEINITSFHGANSIA
jgi:hypothetical protein